MSIIEKVKCYNCGFVTETPDELNDIGVYVEKFICLNCHIEVPINITPVVTSNPEDDDFSIPFNSNVVLTFNVSMDQKSVIDNISMIPSMDMEFSFDTTGKILTINPTGNFTALTEYEVSLSKSAKTNNNVPLKNDVVISFTTLESASFNNLVSGVPVIGTPELAIAL